MKRRRVVPVGAAVLVVVALLKDIFVVRGLVTPEKVSAAIITGDLKRLRWMHRAREAMSPELSLARQRAENDLADLERTRKERMEGLERLRLARHGPVRHIATALVVSPGAEVADLLAEEIDPDVRHRSKGASASSSTPTASTSCWANG